MNNTKVGHLMGQGSIKDVTFPPLKRTVSPNQDNYGVSLPK
jgi:hypothetical protein